MSKHGSMCVCVRRESDVGAALTPKAQNRPKAACVSQHTHGFGVGMGSPPTHSRIHTNYIRTNERVTNRDCIRFDYIGGGRDV